jgi:hypothetical protein
MTKLSIDAIAVSLHAARAAAPSTNRDALGTEGQLHDRGDAGSIQPALVMRDAGKFRVRYRTSYVR